MRNCIITGPSSDELGLDDFTRGTEPGLLNFLFEHCIVRVDEILDAERYPNFFDNCVNCLNTNENDILFRDEETFDYRLDTMSIAEQKAIPLNGISIDLLGISRDISMPDIGCHEFED